MKKVVFKSTKIVRDNIVETMAGSNIRCSPTQLSSEDFVKEARSFRWICKKALA